MEISIVGKPRKIDRKQVRKAIKFFANELLSPQMLKNITINVFFIKGLSRRTNDLGSCGNEDNYPYNPRDFTIELDDNMCKRTTLSTTAHEMVHVKQYATGELKDEYTRKRDTIRWRGKYFKIREKSYMQKTHNTSVYPFEKDANRKEKILYRKYKEYGHQS